MKRFVAAAIAAVALFGSPAFVHADGEAVTYDGPQKYNLFDLSPFLPQKAGHLYDGMWSDGAGWLVTNGSLLLTVNGKTGAITNLSRQLDEMRIYGIYNAAGANGTWLIVASADGDAVGSPWLYEKKSSIRYLELKDGVLKPVTLDIDLSTNRGMHAPITFSADGRIYLLSQSPTDQGVSRLYEYRDGSITPVMIPDWAQQRLNPYENALFQDGNAFGAFRWTYDSADFQELRFDGSWRLINVPDVVDQATQMRYAESRGLLDRSAYAPNVTTNLTVAYNVDAPRDAFLSASRREEDGVALLSGFGTNGARLILAKPVITLPGYDNWVGTINLDVTRVRGSASRYVLTAHATGPVKTIRILKDGVGIARCDAMQTCSAVVDVKGTADRFEAWGVSAYPVVPALTSKSVLLRDTARITDTPAWASMEMKKTGWSWLRPSDFTRPETDRATWHIGAYLEHPMTFVATPDEQRNTPSMVSPVSVRRAIASAKTLTVETYIEGRLTTTCRPPIQALDDLKSSLAAGVFVPYSSVRIDACPASVAKTDAASHTVTQSSYGYTYTTKKFENDVRVYGKITWTDDKGTHVVVSPTDTVRFE